jgi:peroxiredoxin Q/BCP
MTERLAPGDTAPAFTLTDADGQQISLADYAGGKVIVYFYPAAMTPGCTTQAVDFTAAVADLDSAGLAVVGISPDSPEKLAQFKAAQSVAFPLLADPDKKVLMAYAAYGSKMLYGKLVEGVIRSTFVVDVAEDGTGTVDVAQYNVKATGHVDKLKRDLKI